MGQELKTVTFDIEGEFITRLAREWMFLEGKDFEKVMELLSSCMCGTDMSEKELHRHAEEFGGGYIKDTYYDYGYVFHEDEERENADLCGILAYWNKCEGMIFDGEEYPATMKDILERGRTCEQSNRCKGISIGCYDEDIDKLKYPLKLVSASYKGTYEECNMRSYGDPEQGFVKTYWKK
ncbi:MAG: hypothetical protein ACLRVD_08410 [Blautia caecimuris]